MQHLLSYLKVFLLSLIHPMHVVLTLPVFFQKKDVRIVQKVHEVCTFWTSCTKTLELTNGTKTRYVTF